MHKSEMQPFDNEHARLAEVVRGIRRDRSKRRQKQAAAFDLSDLHAILALDDAGSLAVALDKAVIALGFGHALRGPSELLELDYVTQSEGLAAWKSPAPVW